VAAFALVTVRGAITASRPLRQDRIAEEARFLRRTMMRALRLYLIGS